MSRRAKLSTAVAPDFQDFAWRLAAGHNESFSEILRQYLALSGRLPELSYWTLISSNPKPWLSEALQLALRSDQYSIAPLIGESEAVLLFAGEDERLLVFQVPTQHEGVVHLVSDSPHTDRAWRIIQRAVRHSFVDLSSVVLDQSDVLSIAEGLRGLGAVEVSRMTARFRDDDSSISRGWKRKGNALRPSPAEAVGELGDRGTVRTLTLQIEDTMFTHLRREAGATLYSGSLPEFQRLVLDPLARCAADRRLLLAGRYRRPRQEVDPISVRFNAPVFAEVASLGSVIHALESVSGVGVAVLHRNPYLHVVATSYEDGSAFDVMVTRSDEIEIYPGFRASMAAYSNVIQQVVDVFGGAEVGSHSHREAPALAVLFG